MSKRWNQAGLRSVVMMGIGIALAIYTPAVSSNTTQHPYADVKGWAVQRITQADHHFLACQAVKQANGAALTLVKKHNMWEITVPTQQTERFGGAILSVDKVDFDAQFGFEKGVATKALSSAELDTLKQGDELGIEIAGDPIHYWPLAGSAAAVLKVEACYQQYRDASLPSSAPVIAQCDSPTTGSYSCQLTPLAAGEYREAYQIDGAAGTPSYRFKLHSETAADAWVSFDGVAWRFVGLWIPSRGDNHCLEPAAKQTPEAQNNLGQDAWQLCVR